MNDLLISMGVSALLLVVREKQGRQKWARALAKLFAEIQRQAQSDAVLQSAITEALKK